jgi:high-affinity nickel permease
MLITLVSVIVAVLVGCIEALGQFANQLKLQGPIWNGVGALNNNFGTFGYVIYQYLRANPDCIGSDLSREAFRFEVSR